MNTLELSEAPKISVEIVLSEPFLFYYDERFHPGMGKYVAMTGWRAVAKATCEGCPDSFATATLGLGKSATEASAKELATGCLQTH